MHCAICGYEKCKCFPIPKALLKQYHQTMERVESSYYPENDKTLYYVEFNRGGRPGEFTVFRRNYIRSDEEYQRLKNASESCILLMTNEGHPYNILTATYGPDGCVPDKSWIKWMVDALNEKSQKT